MKFTWELAPQGNTLTYYLTTKLLKLEVARVVFSTAKGADFYLGEHRYQRDTFYEAVRAAEELVAEELEGEEEEGA